MEHNVVRLLRVINIKLKYRTARQRYQLLLLLALIVTGICLLLYVVPEFKTCPDVPEWLASTQVDSATIFVSSNRSYWELAEGSGDVIMYDDSIMGCTRNASCYVHQTIPVSFAGDKFLFASVNMYKRAEQGRDGLDGVFYDMYTDIIRVGIRCLDTTRTRELCHITTTIPDRNYWATYWASGLAPAGTKYLLVEVQMLFLAGEANDCEVELDGGFKIHVKDNVPTTEVTILKQPVLFGVLQNTQCVMWETDSNVAKSVVKWRKGGEDDVDSNDVFGNEVTPVTQLIDFCHYLHSACMRGLEPRTSYNYYVSTGSAKSDVYFFTTALPLGTLEHFDMAVISDNQNGATNFKRNIQHLAARDIDFVVHVGDMVQDNELYAWQYQYFKPLETDNFSQTRSFLFVRGNHDAEYSLAYAYTPTPHFSDTRDYIGGTSGSIGSIGDEFLGSQHEYLASISRPYNLFLYNTLNDPLALHPPFYTYAYGNAKFIVLDTNGDVITAPQQFEFLKKKLALTKNCVKGGFLIVFLHACPFTNLWDEESSYNGDEWIRNNYVALFEQYCVDLVISGHTHAYQRGKMSPDSKVTYVVNGGGGGSLDIAHPKGWEGEWPYDVTFSQHHYSVVSFKGCRLTWKVYNLKDQKIDEFAIDKC